MTISEKADLIVEAVKKESSCNSLEVFQNVAQQDFVSIHGPEHHVLDGASLLMAYKNAGGKIDIEMALERLKEEGLKMPGAMCGLWGVCGAITSIGAALAILDETGPLSTDGTWGEHMQYTAEAVKHLGEINGPRCCKRDARIAFQHAVKYVNEHYDVKLELWDKPCEYSNVNEQCIKERCPYYKGR